MEVRVQEGLAYYNYHYTPDCKPQLGELDTKTKRPQHGRQPNEKRKNNRTNIKTTIKTYNNNKGINETKLKVNMTQKY